MKSILGVFLASAFLMTHTGCGVDNKFSTSSMLSGINGQTKLVESGTNGGSSTQGNGMQDGTKPSIDCNYDKKYECKPSDADYNKEVVNDVVVYTSNSSNAKKVRICHIPQGNPAAKQTICVAIPGAVEGHGVYLDGSKVGGHGGDYVGECK